MSNTISGITSGSCFIRAATLHLCVGVAFVGLAVMAHTAQSTEDFFTPELELMTIQPVRSGAEWLLPYQLYANVALTRLTDTAPELSGFDNKVVAEPKKAAIWPTLTGRQEPTDNDRISLRHLLRVDLKDELTNLTFSLRSVSINGDKFKVTFQSRSALIEREQLGIMLQPHSASLLWKQPF